MKRSFFASILTACTILLLTNCTSKTGLDTASTSSDVQVVGAMKNVMWKGELYGTIDLDTITNKQHLYGLGPIEYLAGELLIKDGKAYKSTVMTDSTMSVEETFDVKAPFFVYSHVSHWKKSVLPDSIQTGQQLEAYLAQVTQSAKRPFAFKLEGVLKEATIHIVNLPKGSKVSSPAEAHQGQVSYKLAEEQAAIVGFFSTEHKAIFTHHDTFLHMHLITADNSKMGHVDDVLFKAGTMRLSLPAE